MAKYGYVRVSTKGQENGNGIAAQKEAVINHGAEKDMIFVDVYTGAKTDRPELTRLLGLLHRGDTLIVSKLDRIARSCVDGVQLIDSLVKQGIVIDIMNIGVFDNRPANRFQLQVMFAMAEFERDLIRERLMEGKAIAKQSPDFTEGRPPKWSRKQYNHAMKLLTRHSFKEVADITGIPIPTLKAEKRKRKDMELKLGLEII
jgi:DNA invertase Pin-like site-specific DNA recombinase